MEILCVEISTIDVLSILVAILSLLVTALLGWQIFNAITFDKKVKSIEGKIIKDCDVLIKKTRSEVLAAAFFNLAEAMLFNLQYSHALTAYIKALWNLHSENPDAVEIDICFKKIDYILDTMERDGNILLLPESAIKGYLDELDEVKDRRKDRVVKYFISLKDFQPL